MGARAITTTKQHLISAPLPQATATYTVIEHGFIINKALEALTSKGFEVKDELYRCNQNAEIAQGVYHLNYGNDPDMGMMFAWVNSYDKSTKFKSAIGSYGYNSMNRFISGDMGSWIRKHTGSADQEANNVITAQVDAADSYYNQLVFDKENMKGIILDTKTKAELMGRLYFEHRIVTTEQLSLVRQELKQPSFEYSGDPNSLWALYNHITHALKSSHPKQWMDQQRMIHWFLTNTLGVQNSIVNTLPEIGLTDIKLVSKEPSNQITLDQAIAEAESNNGL